MPDDKPRSHGRCTLPARTLLVVLLSPLVSGVLASRASAQAEPTTRFTYSSQPGSWVGGGRSGTITSDDGTFTITGNDTSLNVSISSTAGEFYFVSLAAPSGEVLRPGVYNKAERAPFRTGRSPGLDVSGNGAGCNQIWGSFVINQIEATNSAVSTLDATFVQHCESPRSPTFKGALLYHALPLKYSQRSDEGDWVGGGENNVYENSTSIFRLTGTPLSVQLSVSGERDYWTAIISPPTGRTLAPGTYETSSFPDLTHARLDVFGNGRGCNQTGTLTIFAITFNELDEVQSLSATFTLRCERAAPRLRGEIHYFN
jgi:hypothetical protein